MIKESINKQIAEALKAKDQVRLSTLRMLSSALNYELIAKQHDLSEEEEIVVVRREAKKRQDAIESLRLAKGKKLNVQTESVEERLAREEKELEILREYLPAQMADSDLLKIVDEVIAESGAEGLSDMGKVIGMVMKKAESRADGSKVSELVKGKLN